MVNSFIRETYWLGGRPPTEQTLVSFTEENLLHGFGTWKIRQDVRRAGHEELLTVIDIPSFGVQTRFQRERDPEGRSLAGILYATVESEARRHELATPQTLVHLVCDERNELGRRFWDKRGFQIAEAFDVEMKKTGERVTYLRMFRNP